jgi:L-lysine exporter family protein LysE/ArgO
LGFPSSVVQEGFVLGIGLIIAIGAQNAFILRQGITRKFVFATALVSFMADAILIYLGVGGLGLLISKNIVLLSIAKWGGFILLMSFGFQSFKKGFSTDSIAEQNLDSQPTTLKTTILASLGFSILNPHVYLDTVVLIGSLGSQYPAAERNDFAIGAIIASFVWFFGLAYGATKLAPIFEKPIADRVLNIFIGLIMWSVGISLLMK